ncbi:MAG: phage portal protein [Chloroflexota bacterium]
MSVENPAVPLSEAFDGTDAFDMLAGEGSTASGARVTRTRVLGYSSVWRAVNLISSGVGRLPIEVYRWIEPKGNTLGKAPDYSHPARKVLRKPNEYTTPIVFRKTIQSHALIEGNGYAYIVRDLAAKPVELLILDPRRTWPVRVNGELWYVSECGDPIPGKRRRYGLVKLPAADVIHIQGLGADGLCGYPVFKLLRETFGTALAARDYGARFFGNDGRPGIALQVPAGMKEETVTKLRESWERIHTGLKNAHRAAILRDGVTLQTFGAGARDAQLLQNREFDAREISNVFGVPSHKLGDPSGASYNSRESENQSFLDDTLDDWLVTWEQELALKLLTEFEKDSESHVIEFSRRALLRTDAAGRSGYYNAAIQTGWMSRDEARAEEGYNPIPEGRGAEFVLPVNVAAAPAPGEGEPAPEAEPIPAAEPAPAADPAADPNADPAATADTAQESAASGDLQGAALNGAQITSLLLVADAVAAKRYPQDAAEAIVQASFPLMPRDLITKFMGGLAAYQAPPVADPAAPAPTPAPAEPAAPSTNAAPLVGALRGLAADTLARMVRRVGTGAERLAGKPAALSAYLAGGAHAEHRDTIAAAAAPFVAACKATGRACFDGDQLAAGLLADLAGAIRPKIGRASDLAAAVREAVAAVESSTPARIAADLFPE